MSEQTRSESDGMSKARTHQAVFREKYSALVQRLWYYGYYEDLYGPQRKVLTMEESMAAARSPQREELMGRFGGLNEPR